MSLITLLQDMPIRRKLTFTLILSTGVALFFAMAISIVQQWFLHRTELIDALNIQAAIISTNSTAAILANDKKSVQTTLDALKSVDYIEFASIYDKSGNAFAFYTHDSGALIPLYRMLDGQRNAFSFTHLDMSRPIFFGDERVGTISVHASLLSVYQQIALSLLVMIIAAFGGLGAALMLIARMNPAIVGPMENLVGLMRAVSSEKNYALRSAVHTKDEIGALAEGFNDMLEQIQTQDFMLEQSRAHLEQEVAKRTASLTEAQRIAHLGNWEWDVAQDKLTWSDEIYHIFGLAPQQFGANYDAFMRAVHPDDREYLEKQVREALKHKQAYTIDHRILRPDGSMRYVRERGEVLCNKNGQPVRVLGTIHDVTESWQIQTALMESEKRFRDLVEQSSDWIWEVDTQGIYSYVSPQCEAILGYDANEIIGKTPFDFMPPEEVQRVAPIFQKFIQIQQPFSQLENINLHKDGHPVVLESNGVPIFDLKGEFHGYRGMDRDISGRKKIEIALRKQQELTTRIIEAIPHFVFWKDRDSNYLGCNANFARAVGLNSPEEIVGKNDFDLPWAEGEAGRFRKVDSEVMTAGKEKLNYEEDSFRTDKGNAYVVKSKIPLRDAQGAVVGVLGIYLDITGRREAEEKILKQQELTNQIIETIPMRVFWKDQDLRYLGSNTLFAKDAGFSRPDELIGKSDFDMGWKDHAELYRADDLQVMSTNIPKLFYDEPQATPDGANIWLRTSKVPLHNEANATIGMLGVYEDITEYKLMELRLRESEERFRKAFQHSAIGMALVGLDGLGLE